MGGCIRETNLAIIATSLFAHVRTCSRRQLVCPSCDVVKLLDKQLMVDGGSVSCAQRVSGQMRFRIMLEGDQEVRARLGMRLPLQRLA
jgi:hypothetical protein